MLFVAARYIYIPINLKIIFFWVAKATRKGYTPALKPAHIIHHQLNLEISKEQTDSKGFNKNVNKQYQLYNWSNQRLI